MSGTFPPTGQTSLQTFPPAYPYSEYADDDDIQAFFMAYNELAQLYVNTFNQLNLPIYTGGLISGPLLDWVGAGVYGYPRPSLETSLASDIGPLNTWGPNTSSIELNASNITSASYAAVSDDYYRRLLTWHFYKGDGKVFCIPWLKRRVYRFLYGVNGVDPGGNTAGNVNVNFGLSNTVNIVLPSSANPASTILQTAIQSGAAEMPFQFAWNVTVI